MFHVEQIPAAPRSLSEYATPLGLQATAPCRYRNAAVREATFITAIIRTSMALRRHSRRNI